MLIPAILAIYLAAMSIMAWPDYQKGIHSAAFYFGVIASTALVIVLLFFFMRKRDRLRAEREADMRRH